MRRQLFEEREEALQQHDREANAERNLHENQNKHQRTSTEIRLLQQKRRQHGQYGMKHSVDHIPRELVGDMQHLQQTNTTQRACSWLLAGQAQTDLGNPAEQLHQQHLLYREVVSIDFIGELSDLQFAVWVCRHAENEETEIEDEERQVSVARVAEDKHDQDERQSLEQRQWLCQQRKTVDTIVLPEEGRWILTPTRN